MAHGGLDRWCLLLGRGRLGAGLSRGTYSFILPTLSLKFPLPLSDQSFYALLEATQAGVTLEPVLIRPAATSGIVRGNRSELSLKWNLLL